MIRPGTYKALPVTAAWAKSSGKGTDYVDCIFKVFEKDAEIGEIEGQLWWTDKTKQRTTDALIKMGWSGEDEDDGTLIGGPWKLVDIGIKNETFNDNVRLKVDWVGEPPKLTVNLKEKDRLTKRDADLLKREVRAAMGLDEQF